MLRVTKTLISVLLLTITVILLYITNNIITAKNKPLLKVWMINVWSTNDFVVADKSAYDVNIITQIIREALDEKYTIKIVEKDYDVLLIGPSSEIPIPPNKDGVVKIYYTAEVYLGDIQARIKDCDLVLGYDFINDKPNYMRLPNYYGFFGNDIRHDFKRPECNPKDTEFFACFLVRNYGYSGYDFNGAILRNRLFYKLSLYKFVASGGKALNNIGDTIPYDKTREFLSKCKFTIAYENNVKYPGYVTEKPFQSWLAGSVPIYNTHPAGVADLNKKAMIFAPDFASEDDLVEYIKKVDQDDKLYCKIYNEHIITNHDIDYEVVKSKLRKKFDEIFAKKLKKLN